MRLTLFFGLLASLFLLSACSRENGSPTAEPVDQSSAVEPRPTEVETVAEAPSPTVEQSLQPPAPSPLPPAAGPQPPSPSPNAPDESAAQGDPIEVTYFTPSQGEGPYYPINKLDERDNDLTVLEGASGPPAGRVVEFGGIVYDASGMPQPGILVEIWQTDDNGVYLHPGDPGTEQRDRNFQFYGESITTDDGRYEFRTILPGRYEPRPRHIHVKLKLDGQELLTTQFYFSGDPELAGESMFNQVGPDGQHLVITLEETLGADGNAILVGQRDVILNIDLPG